MRRPGRRVLADPLGDDVAGAGQGLLDGLDALLRVDEGRRPRRRGPCRPAGQRGQRPGARAPFPWRWWPGCGAWAGRAGRCPPARPASRRPDLGLQLVGQQLALAQGLEDGLAALVELGELLQPVADRGDGHLVQAAGGLLAVAGDEGHRAPLVEQAGRGLHLAGSQAQFNCDLCDVFILHGHLAGKNQRQGPLLPSGDLPR